VEGSDVVIVGGGPAGSACAWSLRRAGLDVVIVDRALFPRDKVCAGWITPRVLDDLQIDPDDYRRTRTLQPITGFRVGVIGEGGGVDVTYGRPVSFGVRRCEFDHYLLRRSGARLMLGAGASAIRRDAGRWIVDDTVSAPMLVGAGGHFCPVARMLNGARARGPLVVAQEVERPIDRGGCQVDGEKPELYFSPDLAGYGWCVRKGDYVNVGFGRQGTEGLPAETARFVRFLTDGGRIGADVANWRWRGHAYRLARSPGRGAIGEGVMLIGDACGLAYPQSGEGIRPAIQSGLMAAAVIAKSKGGYARHHLESYARELGQRFGVRWPGRMLPHLVPAGTRRRLARRLLREPWFVRRVLLDRWFLHA
jgi:flavin-dependent dehydrogenase